VASSFVGAFGVGGRPHGLRQRIDGPVVSQIPHSGEGRIEKEELAEPGKSNCFLDYIFLLCGGGVLVTS
jgi:hypothetical protein